MTISLVGLFCPYTNILDIHSIGVSVWGLLLFLPVLYVLLACVRILSLEIGLLLFVGSCSTWLLLYICLLIVLLILLVEEYLHCYRIRIPISDCLWIYWLFGLLFVIWMSKILMGILHHPTRNSSIVLYSYFLLFILLLNSGLLSNLPNFCYSNRNYSNFKVIFVIWKSVKFALFSLILE